MNIMQYLVLFVVLVVVINWLREYFDSYRSDFDYKTDTRNSKKIQKVFRRIITTNTMSELLNYKYFYLSGIFGELSSQALESIESFKETFEVEFEQTEKIEAIYDYLFSSLSKEYPNGFPTSETGVGFKCIIECSGRGIDKCQVSIYDIEDVLGGNSASVNKFSFLYKINIQKIAKIGGIALAVLAVLIISNYFYRYTSDVNKAKHLESYLQVSLASNELRDYARANNCGFVILFDTSRSDWLSINAPYDFDSDYEVFIDYILNNDIDIFNLSSTGDGFRGRLLITANGESECWVVANCDNSFK